MPIEGDITHISRFDVLNPRTCNDGRCVRFPPGPTVHDASLAFHSNSPPSRLPLVRPAIPPHLGSEQIRRRAHPVLEPDSDDAPSVLPKPIDLRVERDVIEKLINSFFQDVAPLVPIITQAEFLALSNPSPPPILLYSICLVASCKREVPQTVFDSLRVAVNDVIKSEDVLCTASIVNVQSLLILCQCADVHSSIRSFCSIVVMDSARYRHSPW